MIDSTEIQIRPLTPADCDAYVAFRQEMWPTHAAAGEWETVRQKYFHNPHATLCPESGLYAYFQGDTICGIMGAYPMPITLNGVLHPGHMSVDWAVLPRFQRRGITRKLFEVLASLPGRKFGSSGTRASQEPMERRGFRIPALASVVVVLPFRTALLKILHLAPYAQASPICGGPFSLPGIAESISPGELLPAVPTEPDRTAFVYRGADFWEVYCSDRMQNGAFPLRILAKSCEGYVVMKLMETGCLRLCTLLALRIEPATIDCAKQLGHSLRLVLKKLKVCILMATETDVLTKYFLKSAGLYVFREATHWWIVPKSSDTFSAHDVRWWLTSADRDSHWGFIQPSLMAS